MFHPGRPLRINFQRWADAALTGQEWVFNMPEGMAAPGTQMCSEQHAGQAAMSSAAWLAFIRYCQQLGHGEIEKLKIQNGLPVLAEQAFKKIKFQ